MTHIKSGSPDNKVSTPETFYEEPFEVIRDSCLSWEEKMTALKNWEMDEKAALVADDENMPFRPSTEHEEEHSETLAKINSAAQVLNIAPAQTDEKMEGECYLLTALIAMNIDACMLYREAAASVDNEAIEKNYYALEKVHRQVIDNLSRALSKIGQLMSDAESLYQSRYCSFRGLCASLIPSTDIDTLAIIGKAEEACRASVLEALDDKSLSAASRFYLSGCVRLLQD